MPHIAFLGCLPNDKRLLRPKSAFFYFILYDELQNEFADFPHSKDLYRIIWAFPNY